MNKPLMQVNDLTVNYGRQQVIHQLNFSVERGDYLGIVGSNGSGKTTLVRVILGLLAPTHGSIVFGYDGETSIGYLPQRTLVNDSFFPAQVSEIVGTGLMGSQEGRKMTRSQRQERILETLKLLNMESFLKRKIGTLSIGQQQRVLLARALVSRPDILILDEPTSALDPKIREEFYEMLHHLHKRHEVTIIQVSHDVTSMDKYMNKVLLMGFEEAVFGDYQMLKQEMDFGHDHGPVSVRSGHTPKMEALHE